MAKLLILSGVGLILAGIIIKYAPWLVGWFGNLPGDINVESGRSRIFIPVTSMLLVSVVLSLVINIFRR
ncbi:DUF2905 domain-containing protein [Maridesulfovibrio bastinii]|uniref:DUF2905 domain-containing protein n=1 Tax=Maridesulfovibrio bastinii TaxID=47157 RepID=UPI00040EC1C6|nr:DUF2905 domain-containing protein [Maridesulfovibrio bastinii]